MLGDFEHERFSGVHERKAIISAAKNKTQKILTAIFTKAQTAARWLSGPVIQTGFPKNTLMSLTSGWFALAGDIQRF